MNLLEIHVSNIIINEEMPRTEPDGKTFMVHHLVADKECYGQKEIKTHIYLLDQEYESVMKNGYYLG